MMLTLTRLVAMVSWVTLALLFPLNAIALEVIRDAEIEDTIKDLVQPVYKAAGLDVNHMNIVIVNDDEINAFVVGGMNIFVYTGLLKKATMPESLIGVVAHETGHIKGGHVVRQKAEAKRAMAQMAVGYILGIASALSGSPDTAQALVFGSQQLSERQMLAYSRKHEEAADAFALTTLDKLQITPEGLAKILQMLGEDEALRFGKVDPYALTHPLSKERIERIKHHIEVNKDRYRPLSSEKEYRFKRAVVKLNAFLDNSDKTLKSYPEKDQSELAYLARAIAYYKQASIPKATSQMEHLLKLHPNDGYYTELLGQILFESGEVDKAIPYYRKALKQLPNSSLIQLELALALLVNGTSQVQEARELLRKVVAKEPHNAAAWHQLGIAYGKEGNLGLSYWALAEEAVLTGRKADMKQFIDYSQEYLPKDSPTRLRLKDLKLIDSD